MLIDLISKSNYGQYNVSIANLLGLETAIYLDLLLDINSKAIRKNKVDDNYFWVDRKYITSRTTLDESKQRAIEKILADVGVLSVNAEDRDSFNINISALYTIVGSDDTDVIADIKKIIKKKSNKKTKDEAIIDNLKGGIVTPNIELRNAYCDWIDSVFAKQGWMSKKSVTAAQTVVDEFSNHNLDIALKIVEIASINGYRDMEWAINSYKQNYSVKYKIAQQTTQTSTQPLVGNIGF